MADLLLAGQALDLMAAALGIAELQTSPEGISAAHRAAVYDAVLEYLVQSGSGSRSFANDVKRSIVERFPEMFYLTYSENSDEVDPADERWLTQQIGAHVDYVDGTFAELKVFKDQELPPRELTAEADRRADAYQATINGIGLEGRLRGLKNQMLWWVLGQAEKHCDTCLWLDGQAHTAGWYIRRSFIPGKPGAKMKCWGRHCDCYLKDKNGTIVRISE